LTQETSVPGVLVQISVLEESVHGAQCVVRALPQLDASGIINFYITMFTNHILLTPASFPTCVLKSSKRIGDSIDLNLRRVSLISSPNS